MYNRLSRARIYDAIFSFFILSLFLLSGYTTSESAPSPQIVETVQHIKETTSSMQTPKKQVIQTSINNDTEQMDEFEDEFEDNSTQDDPFIAYNRFMTSFNDLAYTYLLDPTAKVYAALLPEILRIGLANAHHNIQFPIRFVNNLLQLRFENATTEFERFVVNSTLGIAGLMDPAKEYMQLDIKEEDFGQTLGHYGMDSGFHVVLPFLGPSNVRDILGLSLDTYISPLSDIGESLQYKIPNNATETLLIYSGHVVNKNSLHLDEYKSAKKDALDLYIFLRDIYEQKRVSEIAQ